MLYDKPQKPSWSICRWKRRGSGPWGWTTLKESFRPLSILTPSSGRWKIFSSWGQAQPNYYCDSRPTCSPLLITANVSSPPQCGDLPLERLATCHLAPGLESHPGCVKLSSVEWGYSLQFINRPPRFRVRWPYVSFLWDTSWPEFLCCLNYPAFGFVFLFSYLLKVNVNVNMSIYLVCSTWSNAAQTDHCITTKHCTTRAVRQHKEPSALYSSNGTYGWVTLHFVFHWYPFKHMQMHQTRNESLCKKF